MKSHFRDRIGCAAALAAVFALVLSVSAQTTPQGAQAKPQEYLIKPLPPGDKRMVDVPLKEIFRHVKLTALKRRADRSEVLAVDHAAFPSFWRLDAAGLDEAVAATPRTRFRVAEPAATATSLGGYAICGRAGSRGYVQRLAVHRVG